MLPQLGHSFEEKECLSFPHFSGQGMRQYCHTSCTISLRMFQTMHTMSFRGKRGSIATERKIKYEQRRNYDHNHIKTEYCVDSDK